LFDFTKTFDFIGRAFVRALSLNVRQQQGIDGNGYSFIAPSTGKSRRAKRTGTKFLKGIRTKRVKDFDESYEVTKSVFSRGLVVSLKRLFVTGEFAASGFNYSPDKNGVDVFVPESFHKGGATMADIVRYNSRGQSRLNKNIKAPPLVFPNNAGEVALIRDSTTGGSVLERGQKMLKDEIVKQMKEQGILVAKRELHIG